MRIDVLTIFPMMFAPVLNESIIKRAQAKGKVTILVHNLRDFSDDLHRKVDDRPFGGGPGMVMRPEPIFNAIKHLRKEAGSRKSPPKRGLMPPKAAKETGRVILLSPRGEVFKQHLAKKLAQYKHIIIICGHYEGVDERVREFLIDEEISIGDYVLTGGELPAMTVIDCVVRLIPGVLGKKESLHSESFEGNLLEYPQYTRPANYRGMRAPSVLLSGNHKKIEQWRQKQAIKLTKLRRPDLIRYKRRVKWTK
jgi:tRNA (guanine37-N1)-methyltransferase